MKRLICLVIVLAFTFCVNLPVYATSNKIPIETQIPIESQMQEQILYSEYDAYIENKQKTDEELLAEGFTIEEIQDLKDFCLEDALMERASHTEEELYAMGYTDEQIELLKAYDGSPLTADNPVLAATAVCTGSIIFNSYNTSSKQLMFLYHFSWSSIPICGHVDTVAVSWQAIDSNAHYISSSATYKRATIYLSSTSTGEDYSSQTLSLTAMPGFNGYKADYESVQTVPEDNGTLAVWAKEGYIWFGITPDGNNTISTLKVYGAVGHKTLALATSVGFDASSGSYSFSFTPTYAFDTVGAANYTLKPDGTCYAN